MSFNIDGKTYYTLSETAIAVGRSKQTIVRWSEAGKIPEPARLESNGWRIYSSKDLEKIKRFANKINVVSKQKVLPNV